MTLSSDFEMSRELADALDGRRDAALYFWQSIANGAPLDLETTAFLRQVAAAIVDADRTPGRARYAALTAACGLAGDRSLHPEVERFVDEWLLAHELRSGGAPWNRASLVQAVIDAGLSLAETKDAMGRRRVGGIVDRIIDRRGG